MRFVLCDADGLVLSMVETILERHGHEVVGVADHTAVASDLVRAGRPDAVVVDLSLGYNTDFDIIGTAREVGSRVVVFSHNADHTVLERFDPPPIVVPKPDFVALEAVIERLSDDGGTGGDALTDRRVRPVRAAVGPVPAGLHDAQAFYEALANATDDDAMLSIEAAEGAPPLADDVAKRVQEIVRGTDRVLAMATAVRVFLAGPGPDGLAALLARLAADRMAERGDLAYRSTVVGPGETGVEVFDRLKLSELKPLR